ncbi:histone-lysine N-methyltransferase SETMAR [Trichonephila clavipes]|nr:histone-lysine N-methyltransferase SETMAR [Trichonephila clavipes]
MQRHPKRISELDQVRSDSHRPKKFKAQLSAGKVMFMALLDIQRPLLLEFKELSISIRAQRYIQTLDKLQKAIQNELLFKLSSGVIILHNNARPRGTKVCVWVLSRKKWEAVSPNIQLTVQICRLATITSLCRCVNDFTPTMT